MKKYKEYSESDQDAFNDVIIDALTAHNNDTEPTDNQLDKIYNTLPIDIKFIAEQWGLSDTVFKDRVYDYLTEDLKDNRPYE